MRLPEDVLIHVLGPALDVASAAALATTCTRTLAALEHMARHLTAHLPTWRFRQLLAANGCAGTVRVGREAASGTIYAVSGWRTMAFDLRREEWRCRSPVPSAPRGTAAGTAVAGHLYVVGGEEAFAASNKLERYDPRSDTWTRLPDMFFARARVAATSVANQIYVAGGRRRNWQPCRTFQRYDVDRGTWTVLPSMPTERYSFGLVAHRGVIWCLGGQGVHGAVANVERYVPGLGIWFAMAPLSIPRSCVAAAAFQGKIWVVGGCDRAGRCLRTVEVYDGNGPVAGPPLNLCRSGASLVAAGGRLWCLGGFSAKIAYQRTMEVLDSGTWRVLPMPLAQAHMAAALT